MGSSKDGDRLDSRNRGILAGSFEALDPETVLAAAEASLPDASMLEGSVSVYPSYINRVYGLRKSGGDQIIAKFYRPGRWSSEAIVEEHRFIRDCRLADIPVAEPIALSGGGSLGEVAVEGESGEASVFTFALFPRMGGRNFDAESDDDWRRLGSIVARCHLAGLLRTAPSRKVCTPELLTEGLANELVDASLVHPDLLDEFASLCSEGLGIISPLFDGLELQRVHGDCHRGNILDRMDEGLFLMDFDDMMMGPAIQDLWLLLPGKAWKCLRELSLLVEGYESWKPLDRRELALIEPLRFMRMIYFLTWRARQRGDTWFARDFPDWGTRAFWEREIEDLREQAEDLKESLDRGIPRI